MCLEVQYATGCIGTDYWRDQVCLEHSLDGGTGRGCVPDAVIYAPACVEGRPRPPGGGMSQIRDGTQVPAVFFEADCP